MDTRPIGVFDSGLGGLTAMRQLRQRMPCETILYFGDTSRVPYGNRSPETILRYARQDLRFLRTFDPKAVLIACGTVSSNCLEILQKENDIPIVGVVEPTVRRAVEATRNKRVGLIATRASVSSGAYHRMFRRLDREVALFACPCPLFVPLVEEGRFTAGDVVIETVAREYLTPLKDQGIDTLVLGCTHYPLLAEIISGVMGPEVRLVDAGRECAREVERVLAAAGGLAPQGEGTASYYVSDRPEDFARSAEIFLQRPLETPAQQISIEAY